MAHGATCSAVLTAGVSEGAGSRLNYSSWIITGQEGGALVRTPLAQLFEGKSLTKVNILFQKFFHDFKSDFFRIRFVHFQILKTYTHL